MPPALDIYVLTEWRELTTIDLFLDAFVDRAASDNRGGEDIMMVTSAGSPEGVTEEGWTCEPARTLSHAIGRGLEDPRRGFTLYLASCIGDIDRAYLAFTTDNKLVIGVSIDDTGELPGNDRRARELLRQLAGLCGAFLGTILVEQPPPLSELAFRASESDTLSLFFWRQNHTPSSAHAPKP